MVYLEIQALVNQSQERQRKSEKGSSKFERNIMSLVNIDDKMDTFYNHPQVRKSQNKIINPILPSDDQFSHSVKLLGA